MMMQSNKSGAALVIVLGFLAILTITIIAFSTQTRSERLAGRAFTSTAQTRHLLNAALTRAMEDLDTVVGTNYPSFFAFGSQDDAGSFMADAVNFGLEEDYFAIGNDQIEIEYDAALNTAVWQTVNANSPNGIISVGRVGYIVINSSGLLDANEVGGTTEAGENVARRAGISSKEIQLSNNNNLIDEFNASAASFKYIDADNPGGILRSVSDAQLSPAVAFAYNRENAWHRFETLRDVYLLNRKSPLIFTQDIASFSTFSFDPREDARTFMGTNWTTVTANEAVIRDELTNIGIANPDFVFNQLRDYLDTDTIPEDENGDYTDYSVEPVPLINEMALTCNFTFTPEFDTSTDVEGNPVIDVTSVIISNHYELELEVWYPFVGYENIETYSVHIDDPPIESGDIPVELFGFITDWTHEQIILPENITPGSTPFSYVVADDDFETEVFGEPDLISLFESMQSDIQFPSIYCADTSAEMVDRVQNLELPMDSAVSGELMPIIQDLAATFFASNSTAAVSNQFVAGMACVDPRLNWDGTSLDQWEEEMDAGDTASVATMGEINEQVISDHVNTPDDTDKIFVRNTDQIDTPWEFTYFLYDTSKPWRTFQMLAANDDDNTRLILQNLSPYPDGPPTAGRINPYSPHTNVIASVFMNMPVNEFNSPDVERLTASQATTAAEVFMKYVADKGWPDDATKYGTNIFETVIDDSNPWEQEAFFRNSYELFNPRDTLYTILLAAQNGTDINNDGVISDDEVRSTQKAVVYIWRDPVTKQAACVFYGLSDTLQSSIGSGDTWKDILQNFEPNP